MVLDASAVVELLLASEKGRRLGWRLRRRETSLHAPHLIDLEVAQTLRRYLRTGELEPGRGQAAVEALSQLALYRHRHDFFLPRIWELKANVTAYDAAYLALAEALEAPLLTCDERLLSAPGHRAQVEVV